MRAYQKPLVNAEISKRIKTRTQHCVKSVRIRSFSDPHFPAFGLKTERYGVSLRIHSECGKIWARKTQNTDTFHAVLLKERFLIYRIDENKFLFQKQRNKCKQFLKKL